MKRTVIALFIVAFIAGIASAEPLPAGRWTDLLHLGSTYGDRISGGSIDTDYLNGEASIMPAPGDTVAGITGATEDPMVWTPLHDDDGHWQPNLDDYVMYWHIYILSPDQRDVTFHYGHDDDIRVWNNGELIIAQGGAQGNQVQDSVLYAGLNSITIKLVEGGGGDWMEISVTDRAGNDFTDLQYSLAPVGLSLVNQVTGSKDYTNQTTVDLAWLDEGIDVAGYQVTDTDTEPTEWLPIAPTTYSLPDITGEHTVFGWIKTAGGKVLQSAASITYTTLAPVASAKDLAVEAVAPDYPPAVVYPADIDDGSYDPAGGELLTGAAYYYITCPDDQTPGQPYVTLEATTPVLYMATLTVTNEAGTTASVPFAINIVAGAEPTTENLTWDGEGGLGNQQWTRGLNWDLDQPPANPTNASITFTELGANPIDEPSVTNVLVPGTAVAVTENAEPFAFTPGDTLGISANGGPVQPIFIDGADVTAATAQEVVDSMNAFATGFTASVTAEGKVEIAADNASPSSLVFSNIGGTPVETLGLPLETPVVPEWNIGTLYVRKSDIDPPAEDFMHTTDLNGGKLVINGNVDMGHYNANRDWGISGLTFENGTVQVGSAAAKRNMILGNSYGYNAAAALKMAPGSKLEAYLNYLKVGEAYKAGSTSSLDLRGCEIVGGVLSVQYDLYAGWNNNGANQIMLDDATGLQSIEVGRTLAISANMDGGNFNISEPVVSYIGDPDNNYLLPPDVSIKVGDSATDVRGNLYVGWSRWAGSIEGILAASSGGTFDAYVNQMRVGCRTGWYHRYATGLLDLSPMESAVINANSLEVGVGVDNNIAKVDGQLLLPVGGTVTTNSLHMGDDAEECTSLIDLPDATLTVNESLDLENNANIIVHVQGFSCGIELPADVAFDVRGTALIEINFNEDQNANDEASMYYGLRWFGDHIADLQPLINAGNLVINDAAVTGSAGLFYDEATDATYVTVQQSWPLVAVAKNLTIEVDPDDPTAIVAAEDVEAGSYDPNGYTIVSYILNSVDDQTPTEDYVTLTGLGEHTVTLLVTNDNDPADIATKDCTVTLAAPVAATANNVTWSGGADLTMMDRPEWIWGSNWVGGAAPQNPTTATITFSSLGLGTNVLSGSRAVIIGERTEPFTIYDADEIGIDANGTLTTYTFTVEQFADIGNATAQEVVDILNADAVGFEASAVGGKIVIASDAGADSTLQVVDVIDGTAARLGLPTDPATAKRMVGAIEYLNPLNSGLDTVEHITDLNGQSLTITDQLRCGWYSDEHADHGITNGTFINGDMILGSPDAPADILIGLPGYGGACNSTLTIGANTTLVANLGTVEIVRNMPGNKGQGALDLRQTVVDGGVLKMQQLLMGAANTGGASLEDVLMIGPNTLNTIEVTGDTNIGGGSGSVLAYIGDPDNNQQLPANTSIKLGSETSRGNFTLATSGYNSANAKVIATAGGTFDANVDAFTVAAYNGPTGATVNGTLDIAAMDSCAIDAVTMTIGGGNPSSTNATVTGTVTLPAGTAVVDTLSMGGTSFHENSSTMLQLNNTQFIVATAAVLNVGSTVDIQLDGTSSGLDIDAFANLTVEDGAAINITFAAPSGSDPYYGIRWAGDKQADLQALIDAGKITTDTTAVGADAVVYTDAEYTYVGVQSAAPTWPIEGDANMDCKVNIIDLIFVRNRLNGDVASDDNWQADVNGDGKINIIDLIYVRNRLNTRCPE